MKLFFDNKWIDSDGLTLENDVYSLFEEVFGDATEEEVVDSCVSIRFQFYEDGMKYDLTDENTENLLEAMDELFNMDNPEAELVYELWMADEGDLVDLIWHISEYEYTEISDMDEFVKDYILRSVYTKDAEEVIERLLSFVDSENYFDREIRLDGGNYTEINGTWYELHW